MSRTRAHGLRVAAWAACLACLGAGCRSLSPPADSPRSQFSRAAGDPSRDENEGWLFRRLTGQDKRDGGGQREGAAAAPQSDPAIQLTSAVEPVSSGPSPEESMDAAPGKSTRLKRQPKHHESEDTGFLSTLAPSNVYKSVKAWAGYGPNEEAARTAFQEGKDLFRQKRYDEAAKKFAVAADRWPDSALEEDALFLLGECYFFTDRYPKAHDTYEALLKKYEFSRHLDRVAAREFSIGRYWEQAYAHSPEWVIAPNFTDKTRPLFDTWGNALKAYEHVRMNDPGGPLGDDAVMAVANANFIYRRYEEAAHQYDILRKEYPKSEHQLKAHLLALEAKRHVYQGPLYDGAPLKEAGEIADQALVRFGPTLGRERDGVIDAKNRIVEERALRDWSVAQYYEKNRYYGSARLYYQTLIDEYPQTSVAQAARERLEAIKDLPAEPPNHFKWLTNLFESKKRRR